MGNITENKLNLTITAADLATINTGFATILSKLPPGSLNDDQRDNLQMMDVDNKIFAEDCINEVTISGAGIMPPFINAVFMQNDLTLFEQVDIIEANALNLAQRAKDLKRIAADELMTASNAAYAIFEQANKAGIPGAKQAYEKLRERYKKQKGNNPSPTPETNA